MFNAGDFEGGAYFAEQNLRTFAELDVDAIITACPSCGLALKHEWQNVLDVDVPEEFASKIYDFTEFLVDRVGITDLGLAGKEMFYPASRVTYHDPCHLARGMGVREQPRQLLASLPVVDFAEMPEADKCCGGGGAFSIYYPKLSRLVGRRKAADSAGTATGLVATGCPSCVMQLREMLRLTGRTQVVRHTACLLWEAVKGV